MPRRSMLLALGKPALRSGTTPFYRQIYERVRQGIAAGAYKRGARLPSARQLASDLGVARGTVEDAYSLLQAEGYIERLGQRGSVVAHSFIDEGPSVPLVAPKDHVRAIARSSQESGTRSVSPFQLGRPAFDAFPHAVWSRLLVRMARQPPAVRLAHPNHNGHMPLKAAIARYLGLSRGVFCAPEQIIITNGYQAAIDLIARTLLRPGHEVWFEEPGYLFARHALEAANLRIVPVRVDQDGMNVGSAIVIAPKAKLAVVTPAHQSPLCVALSLPRRLQLLKWASENKAWIVEDDYDGEFHYGGRPLPALKSLDRLDRVIYCGSFSKTLLPELRLGYLVAPRTLIAPITAAATARSVAPGFLVQAAVADLLESGHFARHLHRMRRLYAERRKSLALALQQTFGSSLSIEMQSGGMHILARLPPTSNDLTISRIADEAGLAVQPLSKSYIGRSRRRGLLLGFTNVPAGNARPLCEALHKAISDVLVRS